MDWTYHEGQIDFEDVRALLALHFAEMMAGTPPSACHVLEPDALADPAIRFVTLRDGDGGLLGCGALKRLDEGHGEVKSMRTAPAALGRGVGGALLARIIEMAKLAGMSRLSLETGNGPSFAAAIHLYRRAGFRPCGPFGDYRPSDFTSFYSLEI